MLGDNQLPLNTALLKNVVIQETRKYQVNNLQTDGAGNIIGFSAAPIEPSMLEDMESEFRKGLGAIVFVIFPVISAFAIYALVFAK